MSKNKRGPSDTWAQMILDDMGINAQIEDVLSEIIGEDYVTVSMIDWPELAAKNSYSLDPKVWNLEISSALYMGLKSLFKQYKDKHANNK